MRATRYFVATALLASVAACSASDTTLVITDPPNYDAGAVATYYTRLADSLTSHGGDASLGGAYSALAEVVRQNGRISPITVAIDGVPTVFLATARQTEIPNSPCGATPGCLALGTPTILRSLIAWQPDNPKRIIQLTSASDRDSVYTQIYPSLVAPNFPTASLVFMDGNGGMFFGTGGTQKSAMTATTTACPSIPGTVFMALSNTTQPVCTTAFFTVQFASKVEPSSFLAGRNNATGSHTLAMESQQLLGARLQLAPGLLPTPPIPPTPAVILPASLTATVDGDVYFALAITNDATTPTSIIFSSSQQYDFHVIDAATGATVWTWSADKGFFQAFNTQSIGAKTSVIYTARWIPTQKGSFYAVGSLVSQSHRADAKATFTVK